MRGVCCETVQMYPFLETMAYFQSIWACSRATKKFESDLCYLSAAMNESILKYCRSENIFERNHLAFG